MRGKGIATPEEGTMEQILKYHLNVENKPQAIMLPTGAIVRRVGCQKPPYQARAELYLWAQGDLNLAKEERSFAVVWTGQDIPTGGLYLGSGQAEITGSTWVWHVFELFKPKAPATEEWKVGG